MNTTSKRWLPENLWTDLLLILVGSALLAVAYSLFIAPYKIIPGGVYGISIIINYLTKGVFSLFPEGLPIGKVSYLFNIPLFLLAIRIMGRYTAVKTAITFLLIGFFTDLIEVMSGGQPIVTNEPLLCSFYGGALLGVSVSMIFKANSTCAGTDTLARILSTRSNIKVGTLIIIVDSIIVLAGLLATQDWRVPLYSWITIFIYGKVVETLQPQDPYKSVFIISDRPQEIRDALVDRMGVRGTFLHGKGMYKGVEREIIFIIIQRKNIQPLKQIVLEIDSKAFITTANASNDSSHTIA